MSLVDSLLIIGLIGALASGRIAAHKAFLTYIVLVLAVGSISFEKTLQLAADPALAAILCLVLFSRVLSRLAWLRSMMFSDEPHGMTRTLLRFLGLTAALSSVSPNTAVVGAFMGPAATQPRVPAHMILLPLSYMSLAGGMMTPFGTSASVITTGLAANSGIELTFLHFVVPGFFTALAVYCALVIFAPFILQKTMPTPMENSKHKVENFHIEGRVFDDSGLIGRSIAEAGLRNLDSFFVAEIIRSGRVIAPVSPSLRLAEGDVLILVGDIDQMEDLTRIGGLDISSGREDLSQDNFYRVVIAPGSVLDKTTLKRSAFRARFDASVVAVRRGNKRLTGKLGSVPLQAGDMLILAADPDAHTRVDLRSNFAFVEQETPGLTSLVTKDALLATLGFAIFVVSVLTQLIPFPLACFFLVVFSVAMRWISLREVKQSFPFDLAAALWGALVLAHMIQSSGIGDFVAGWLVIAANAYGPFAALAATFFMSWFLTETTSNVSSAVTTLPIALIAANAIGIPPEALAMAVAFGASASFLVPFAYQTHLMVLSPGGYRWMDFIRLGSLVLVVYSIAALASLSIIWL